MKNTLPTLSTRTTPFLWILLMSIMLSASSCEKEKVVEPEPDLPPLTTTGRMTFGCYVNGEPWVAEVPPFQPYHRHTGGVVNSISGRTSIWGTLYIGDINEDVKLIFYKDISQDNISIKELLYHDEAYINYKNSCNNKYKLDSTYLNKVELTHFDIENKIISGIFEMRTIGVNCSDTVLITDGRFDVKFTIVE